MAHAHITRCAFSRPRWPVGSTFRGPVQPDDLQSRGRGIHISLVPAALPSLPRESDHTSPVNYIPASTDDASPAALFPLPSHHHLPNNGRCAMHIVCRCNAMCDILIPMVQQSVGYPFFCPSFTPYPIPSSSRLCALLSEIDYLVPLSSSLGSYLTRQAW